MCSQQPASCSPEALGASLQPAASQLQPVRSGDRNSKLPEYWEANGRLHSNLAALCFDVPAGSAAAMAAPLTFTICLTTFSLSIPCLAQPGCPLPHLFLLAAVLLKVAVPSALPHPLTTAIESTFVLAIPFHTDRATLQMILRFMPFVAITFSKHPCACV